MIKQHLMIEVNWYMMWNRSTDFLKKGHEAAKEDETNYHYKNN